MQRHNPHLIGVCSILAVSVIAFWGFGLAEKIAPQEKILEAKIQNEKPLPAYAESRTITQTPAVTVPKNAPRITSEKKPSAESLEKPVSRLDLLEKNDFSLNLSGTYYVGSPSTSRPANLEIRMRPVPGTNLEVFKATETKLFFDSSRISVENPSITIKENTVLITFASSAAGSFTVKGVLDEPILADKNNKQTMTVQNQAFYLAKKDFPYRLDMAGTLSNS